MFGDLVIGVLVFGVVLSFAVCCLLLLFVIIVCLLFVVRGMLFAVVVCYCWTCDVCCWLLLFVRRCPLSVVGCICLMFMAVV